MLALVVGGLFVVAPPVLPDDAPPAPAVETPAEVVEPALPAEAAEPDVFVIAPAPVEPVPTAPPAPTSVAEDAVVVVEAPAQLPSGLASPTSPPPFSPMPTQVVPMPPWSGSGRFVAGPVMLVAGIGLLTAATFEFAASRDTTEPLVGSVPAGISMLIAGGVMLGTAARDQHRLSEWEAATRIDAPPTGNGLIVAGVTATALGSMAAIATAIASDMELDAPRSIPAGWATAGVALGTGTALMIGGIIRRSRYGQWKSRLVGTPMVVPVRSGAALGFHTQF